MRRPAPLDVVVVTEGPLEVTVAEQGITRVRDAVVVSAPVGGRWVPAALAPGDAVRAGTVLGTLYAVPLDAAALAEAEARRDAARAARDDAAAQREALVLAADEAARTLRRVERLEAAGGASREALEQARTAHAVRQDAVAGASARVVAAEAAWRSARAQMAGQRPQGGGARVVRAPRAGRLLRRLEEQERVLPAGTPLARVGDLGTLEVVVHVLSSDLPAVRPGTPVRFTVGAAPTTVAGAPVDTVRGVVTRVEPAARTVISALGVEEQRVDVVDAQPMARPPLGEGHALEATLVLWQQARVPQLPASAVVRGDTGWVAHLVRRGRATPVPVTLGARGADAVMVRHGLRVGDTVVRDLAR
jgi:HlyD family secretion protein